MARTSEEHTGFDKAAWDAAAVCLIRNKSFNCRVIYAMVQCYLPKKGIIPDYWHHTAGAFTFAKRKHFPSPTLLQKLIIMNLMVMSHLVTAIRGSVRNFSLPFSNIQQSLVLLKCVDTNCSAEECRSTLAPEPEAMYLCISMLLYWSQLTLVNLLWLLLEPQCQLKSRLLESHYILGCRCTLRETESDKILVMKSQEREIKELKLDSRFLSDKSKHIPW